MNYSKEYVEIDGIRIAAYLCNQKGRKAPFVYVHGNCQNHTAGINLFDFFEHQNHPIVSFDLPGHGDSQGFSKTEPRMDLYNSLLSSILCRYCSDLPILAGHSFGGMIALEYVSKNTDSVISLLLLSTTAKDPIRTNKNLSETVESIIIDSRKSFDRRQVYDFSQCVNADEDTIHNIGLQYTDPYSLKLNFRASFTYDITDRLPRIRRPVLILRGENDKFMTREDNIQMTKMLKKPRYIELDSLTHNFPLTNIRALKRVLYDNYTFLTEGS